MFQSNSWSYTTLHMDSCREDQDMPELAQIRWISTVSYAPHSCQEHGQSGKECEVAPGADLSGLVERRDQSKITLRRWSQTHSRATRVTGLCGSA